MSSVKKRKVVVEEAEEDEDEEEVDEDAEEVEDVEYRSEIIFNAVKRFAKLGHEYSKEDWDQIIDILDDVFVYTMERAKDTAVEAHIIPDYYDGGVDADSLRDFVREEISKTQSEVGEELEKLCYPEKDDHYTGKHPITLQALEDPE
jgi:hypothetical protein